MICSNCQNEGHSKVSKKCPLYTEYKEYLKKLEKDADDIRKNIFLHTGRIVPKTKATENVPFYIIKRLQDPNRCYDD
jgi:hypothetical protein